MTNYLIAWVPFCVGGIGDLLIGLVTSYCIAKMTNRKFVIKFDDYPDMSSAVTVRKEFLYDGEKIDHEVRHNNKAVQHYIQTFDPAEWEGKNVSLWSNQNLFQYFVHNPKVDDSGLHTSNERYAKHVCDATREFFETVLEFTEDVLSSIPDLSQTVGIHVRTNDDQMLNKIHCGKYIPFLEELFVKYKEHIESTTSLRSVFIASDNPLASIIGKEIFKGYEIIVNKGPIVCTRRESVHRFEGYKRAFADMLFLGKCKRLYIRMHTNFSRIGAMLNEEGDVYLTETEPYLKNMSLVCNYFSKGTYVKGKVPTDEQLKRYGFKKYNILVCTNAIRPEFRKIVKYGLRSMRSYCDKHGYDLVVHTEEEKDTVYDGERDYPWYKIKLLQRLIEENKTRKNKWDVIVWLDADTVVMNDKIPLEMIIQKHLPKEKCVVLTREQRPPHVANTGFVIVRPGEQASKVMDMIWNNDPKNFDASFHEQASLNDLYERNVENLQDHVHFVSAQFQEEFFSYWYMYKKNKVFIMHVARCGHDKEGFIFTMDIFYSGRLDEETDEQYNRRMNWLESDEGEKAITSWRHGQSYARYPSARNCPEFR